MTTPQNTGPITLREEKLLRYLAGALDEAEIASLSEAMRTDEKLRLVFADMLLQHVHLAEIGREVAAARARRRAAGRKAAFAAAAAVLVAAAGWVMLRGGYPAPQALGTYRLVEGNRIGRGATLMTEEARARLVLGAYCRLDLAPHTVLRIEGKTRDESIFLEKGGVVCEVSPREGAFAVRTRIATVSVTGTKFEVNVLEKQMEGEEAMMKSSGKTVLALAVSVMSGTVGVQYGGRTYELGPGATRVFAEEKGVDAKAKEAKEKETTGQLMEGANGFAGMLAGKVVSKGENKIVVEVSKIERTWPESKAKNPECLVGRRVTIQVDMTSYNRKPANYSAKIRRFFELLKVGDSESFDVKHAGGDVFTFLELSEAQIKRLEQAGAGEERAGTGALPPGVKSEDPPPPVSKDDRVVIARGTVVGTVVNKGEAWVEVKSQSGKVVRYMPEWRGGNPSEGGGPDKDTVRQIGAVRVGDAVVLEWHVNDHYRVKSVKKFRE